MNTTLIRREVRGVSFVNTNMFTQEFRDHLKGLVMALQAQFRIVNASLFGFRGEFEDGSRFQDADQVVDRILRAICSQYALWENPIPKNVTKVESRERQYLGVWAWEGLRDSASSDHWYTHEKRYE